MGTNIKSIGEAHHISHTNTIRNGWNDTKGRYSWNTSEGNINNHY